MLNRFPSNSIGGLASVEANLARDVFDSSVPADFHRLSGEQIERLIARHETPTLWRLDPAPAHQPEPFGMIA
ncbi:MAG TPA: hypothetical protein VH278_03045 [Burkholderiaceae bacterium]|jgi:hypothetical protein|nr:hypothetical protein [Burkholderiaceae bacterium]